MRNDYKSSLIKDISLRGVNLSFGPICILKDAHIRLHNGTKYALVGRNGIGKSTLLRCISNNLIPQWTCLKTFLLQQEQPISNMSPIQMIKSSDPVHQNILANIAMAENDVDSPFDLSELYNQLSTFNDAEMEKKTIQILNNLQFPKEFMSRSFQELSGGWRMKTLLACAVFAEPQLLLLDEPTNHLDIESIHWLIEYLKSLACTVIVVSHDHDFLNSYAQCIIHFTQHELRYYPGNFLNFCNRRGEKVTEQNHLEKKKQQARLIGDVKKLKILDGPKIKKTSKKKLSDLGWVWGEIGVIEGLEGSDGKNISWKFPDPGYSSHDVLIRFNNVSYVYDSNILWENVDLSIRRDERIAIMGKNGIGKSTLLKCIAQEEKLHTGTIERMHNLRIAYFTQFLMQTINYEQSAVEQLLSMYPELKSQDARDYLGAFGICGDTSLENVGVLSGGQKVRFVFALIMFEQPHLILLDEPTSHLDIETTESLLRALNEYSGAVVLISHHTYFLRNLQNFKYYAIENKGLHLFENLDEYIGSK